MAEESYSDMARKKLKEFFPGEDGPKQPAPGGGAGDVKRRESEEPDRAADPNQTYLSTSRKEGGTVMPDMDAVKTTSESERAQNIQKLKADQSFLDMLKKYGIPADDLFPDVAQTPRRLDAARSALPPRPSDGTPVSLQPKKEN